MPFQLPVQNGVFFAIVPLFIGESIPEEYVCNPCSFLKDCRLISKMLSNFLYMHLYGCVVVVYFTTMVINGFITFNLRRCNMAHLNGNSFGVQNFVLGPLRREPFAKKLVLIDVLKHI